MKKALKTLLVLMITCMFLCACAQGDGKITSGSDDAPNDAYSLSPAGSYANVDVIPEKGTYREGVALVKFDGAISEEILSKCAIESATALYSGSKWHTVQLKADTDTVEAVTQLREQSCFDKVDYDYIMTGTDKKPEENPNYGNQTNLGLSDIPYGWTHNGKAPGGSPDVVVAVIDTGVDYNHPDLRNNIWINTGEIPGNGIDDDGNGYVDDVYGWNCVGNNNDPMDDNGHGTHVAGIIAAENNKIGGIGVAYNCKVMVIKAGNSSGYFNNSDIAEAIQYAYMNGASVINMSFGGSLISIAVEEALQNAYNSAVLVAAAGNDGACNNLACPICLFKKVSYPAALPYVIGVMSTNVAGGKSGFSNYDHYPYDSIEYEVYAVGEGVGSTWPSNKYACLDGTSMAAPTVSGIAALLRSTYADREVYSTKFIQSQIVNTGSIKPDGVHSIANVKEALTKVPKPSVNLYDYYVDDSTSISASNNGNGVVDAGETVRLYFSLHNRGGVASNVNVSIDTYRSQVGDESLTDPYFSFVNPSLSLSDIGTYSVRESGEKYFGIVVSSDCPNDYTVDFNIRYTYKNGMDEKDTKAYSGECVAQFTVSSGYLLPSIISEDTTFTNDRLYIVGEDVTILKGVTVTFTEGCRIQFYDDREYYNSPQIIVNGTLNILGSKDKMVAIYPNEKHVGFSCGIKLNNGSVIIDYVDYSNPSIENVKGGCYVFVNGITKSKISNSYLRSQLDRTAFYYSGRPYDYGQDIVVQNMENNFLNISNFGIYSLECNSNFIAGKSMAIYIACPFPYESYVSRIFANNIIYTYGAGTLNDYPGASSVAEISNNMFLSANNNDFSTYFSIRQDEPSKTKFENNTFDDYYRIYADQLISNYRDENGNPTLDVYGSCSDISLLYPHVTDVQISNADGEQVNVIGKEEVTVRVTFNRSMDVNAGTFLTFGTIEPYADYRIDGQYISSTVWEGKYTLKAQIENGQNFLKVNNAWAEEDKTKKVLGQYQLHEFTIDTTAAMSMNLFANPTENGIELNFAQDDYDTLLGYNIYRSTAKDGNYVKLNPAILLPEESTFLDENAEPGKTYWYTYTVVLTDFSESNPAGKVMATALDTLAPNMYHTPVNQGYLNNNLVISCTASDNVAISSVTLYYRAVGATEWKSLTMSKQSDKYSATIFGSELTLSGIEYYIVASDGINTINRGSAQIPYTVIVKDASAISRKGDVDGDGVVTTKDALMLMQCINGDLILSDDEFRRADLNGDGTLNSSEALRILQYVNAKVNTLEM